MGMIDFDRLVETHQRAVVAVALAAGCDLEAAYDVAQETFVAAWRGRHTLREQERVSGWVIGIARNQAKLALRGKVRRRALIENASRESTPPEDTAQEQAKVGADEQTRAALEEALREIDDGDRALLVMHYLDGAPLGEIARALGIGDAAAKKRLQRARDRLRQAGAWAALTAAIFAALRTRAEAAMMSTQGAVALGASSVLALVAAYFVLSHRAPATAPRLREDVAQKSTLVLPRDHALVASEERPASAGGSVSAAGFVYAVDETRAFGGVAAQVCFRRVSDAVLAEYCVTSGSNGRFVARELPPGTYEVTASAPGFAEWGYARGPFVVGAGEAEQEDLVVPLLVAHSLRGCVERSNGAPAARVEVFALHRTEPVFTDERGCYELAVSSGPVDVIARDVVKNEVARASAHAEDDVGVPTLTLAPARRVSGRVLAAEDDQPIAGARVDVMLTGGLVATLLTDELGVFSIAALPEHVAVAIESVERARFFASDASTLPAEPRLERARRLAGHVQARTHGFEMVHVAIADVQGGSGEGLETWVDEDGSFVFDAAPAQPLTLVAQLRTYAQDAENTEPVVFEQRIAVDALQSDVTIALARED